MDKKSVGQRIQRIRKTLKMTQAELGDYLGGLAASTLCAYERGGTPPQTETLSKIANLISLTVDDILNGGDNFEAAVSRKAVKFNGSLGVELAAFQEPVFTDSQVLVEKIEDLTNYLAEISTKLNEGELYLQNLGSISPNEARLLSAYRKLSSERKQRLLADAEDLAILPQSLEPKD